MPGPLTQISDRATGAIEDAAGDGADCVVLPELFDVGYFAFDTYARCAQPIGGDTHGRIRNAAIENDVAVLAGTVVEDLEASAAAGEDVPDSEGLANTAVLFDSDGTRRFVYRKHHLFGYESASLVGRSTAYDPWGTPIAAADEAPTIVHAKCPLDRVREVRQEFPALSDRREV